MLCRSDPGGANLGDLPIRRPSRYCLTVNANDAQNSLGGPAVTSPRATGSGLALMPALVDPSAAGQALKAKRTTPSERRRPHNLGAVALKNCSSHRSNRALQLL